MRKPLNAEAVATGGVTEAAGSTSWPRRPKAGTLPFSLLKTAREVVIAIFSVPGFAISTDATVIEQETSVRWLIVDGERRYVVIRGLDGTVTVHSLPASSVSVTTTPDVEAGISSVQAFAGYVAVSDVEGPVSVMGDLLAFVFGGLMGGTAGPLVAKGAAGTSHPLQPAVLLPDESRGPVLSSDLKQLAPGC